MEGGYSLVFGDLGGGPGQFNDARYQAYGPNDLLYVLDYGNNRMQMLDPANNFDYAGEFPLNPSVTTANIQFGIGPEGNFYLGDGQGGGSWYDSDGTFLGSFALPGAVISQDLSGTPYLTTDFSGHVYVFDETGFHQFSTVPEPSTAALVLGVLTLGGMMKRNRTSCCN
jgi:hypothetical protein